MELTGRLIEELQAATGDDTQKLTRKSIIVTHSVTRGPAQLRSTPQKSQSNPENSSGLNRTMEKANIKY